MVVYCRCHMLLPILYLVGKYQMSSGPHGPIFTNVTTILQNMNFCFLIFFAVTNVTILLSHWCSLFRTSVESAHGFQSQGGCTMGLCFMPLACNGSLESTLVRAGPQTTNFSHDEWTRYPFGNTGNKVMGFQNYFLYK